MPTTEDRITELRARADAFTGIEFVQVVDVCEQTTLRVYFLTDPLLLRPPFEDVGDVTVVPDPITFRDFRIYSPRGEAPDVPLVPVPANSGEVAPPPEGIRWADDPLVGRRYVEISVAEPGTFTDYRLFIDDPRLDRVFNNTLFSFKVGCDNLRDCVVPPNPCGPEPSADFPVDYLARDFVSIRNALLDFAAQRYANWQKPIEADVGVMLAEVMAALGDEFSYMQDRFNREAYLETATERRSLRRKARLMDHEIHDGRMASTLLELSVLPATTTVPIGAPVWVRTPGGVPVPFEVGLGMTDPDTLIAVDSAWNPGQLVPYAFDDDDRCLAAGATELFVENSGMFDAAAAALWSAGRLLLLRDVPADPSEAERVHLVRVTALEVTQDALMGQPLARIVWDAADAPPFPIPLDELELSGNVVPATAGLRRTAFFRLGPLQAGDADLGILQAVERAGPLYATMAPGLAPRFDPCAEDDADDADDEPPRPPIYLLSLPETDTAGLGFADPLADLRRTTPEISVAPVASVAAVPADPWTFRRSLLFDGSDDEVFTLEDGMWLRVVRHWRGGLPLDHRDYARGGGYTIRLGDGVFGRLPVQDSLMRVDYRLGFGARANVPAASINVLAEGGVVSPLQALVASVSNPSPVTNGVDPESAEAIRMLTPEAYQASVFFALRPEDYGTQAETLPFIQRAQGTFQWTGSWITAFAAVDPIDSGTLSDARRLEVETLLEWRRQAGRDVVVKAPRYVNLDVAITLCVAPSAYPGQVKPRVTTALLGHRGLRPEAGFFSPDNFTFGTALRRSELEAAIVAAGGVTAVLGIDLRVLGETDFFPFDDLLFEVADDEVIRVAGDPLRPEQGTVTLHLEGGA